ncbi:MAG TPA: exodeoxyribonuclease VII small subunit [Polyangiaceae bacterium]|nr:exodeoxyribonuclease VII small subunit [Polyangiaceae bacterium]
MKNHSQSGEGEPQTPASFEDSVRRLGEIVEALEAGDLPLERSLELFEEGVRLARLSQARLDAAEKRVEQLMSVDEAGNPVVREIDPE